MRVGIIQDSGSVNREEEGCERNFGVVEELIDIFQFKWLENKMLMIGKKERKKDLEEKMMFLIWNLMFWQDIYVELCGSLLET